MLDGWARQVIDPPLARLGAALARAGVAADTVTWAAFGVGLAAAAAIAHEAYLAGLMLLLASRLGDGLDGVVARHAGKTDFGGFLDIVLDFAFYGAIPFAFVIADPSQNALAGAALILSFYVNGASFLAFAAIAERRGLVSLDRGEKSIFFTAGLAEATETIAFFAAFCLFPQSFAPLAWVFVALCVYTGLSRIVLARRAFARSTGDAP